MTNPWAERVRILKDTDELIQWAKTNRKVLDRSRRKYIPNEYVQNRRITENSQTVFLIIPNSGISTLGVFTNLKT